MKISCLTLHLEAWPEIFIFLRCGLDTILFVLFKSIKMETFRRYVLSIIEKRKFQVLKGSFQITSSLHSKTLIKLID